MQAGSRSGVGIKTERRMRWYSFSTRQPNELLLESKPLFKYVAGRLASKMLRNTSLVKEAFRL